MKVNNPADWYRYIKVMNQGQQEQPQINIPDLTDNVLSNFKIVANCINDKFLSVATDLPACLPLHIECPMIQPKEIFVMLRKLNCQKSTVLGDLPVRIIREFAYEIYIIFFLSWV